LEFCGVEANETAATVADVATGFIPGVGEAADVAELAIDISKGDTTGAAISAVALLVPFGGAKLFKIFRGGDEVVEQAAKNVPNPHGKKGGPAHQAGIEDVKNDIESRGLEPVDELRVKTPNGEKSSRFIDVAAKDPATGEIVEVHQVGKTTKSGKPVSRERKAMKDIKRTIKDKTSEARYPFSEDPTGVFHPYDKNFMSIDPEM